MTQSDKELLLKDLCARLPYRVKIALKNSEAYHHENIAKKGNVTIDRLKGFNGTYFSIYHDNPLDWSWYVNDVDVEDIKPYLFPLSSMTEEQKRELRQMDAFISIFGDICFSTYDDYGHELMPTYEDAIRITNWLNKNHFDFRGLIEKGLAIDATGLNIY